MAHGAVTAKGKGTDLQSKSCIINRGLKDEMNSSGMLHKYFMVHFISE